MTTQSKICITVWNKYCWTNSTDTVILKVIYDLLAYEIPNSRFTYSQSPIKSFLTKKNAFKTGFLPYVYQKLLQYSVEVELIDKRDNVFAIDPEELQLALPSGNLRDRQKEGMDSLIKSPFPETFIWQRGIINAATNFGKNWIITAMVRSVMHKSKVVITVHRRELFAQLYEFFIENHIAVHRYGSYKNYTYRELGIVTLVMPTSMFPNIETSEVQTFLSDVGTLIVDECHRATADDYSTVLSKVNASTVWYLSGTPFTGEANHDLSIVGDSGDVIFKVSNSELIADKVSLTPTVKFYNISGFDMAPTYEDEKQDIIHCPERLRIITEAITENINDVFLISVATKEHGNYLYNKLVLLPTTVDFLYSGDFLRDEKLIAYKEGRIKVLICTEVLKEGVNIPLVRTLINAAWGQSVVWVKQFVGRLLRSDGVSTTCTVIDFLDKGHNTRKHSFTRYNYYQKEGFEINIIEN